MTIDKIKYHLGDIIFNFITREADRPQLERMKKGCEEDIKLLPSVMHSTKFLREVELKLINYMLTQRLQ